ncbi:GH36-type glycosyl hydrolase domain-containing protein [Candidatus Formimonas warabiya]|uniref:Glycosyl transferase n=1 Tax=Formimonas warabiya TaxID=1761012 RepID=A0A3G1KU81_FORW1|nr:glucoamylase family protein [Candidatus Formimonas warabiya]ATW26012.1 glycosyl transferase [Candidatus Formimonas warabiya]
MPLWVVVLCIAALLLVLSWPVKRQKYMDQESKDALLNPEELEKHAQEIAQSHTFSKNTGSSDCLLSRMDRNFRLITAVYRMLNQDIKEKIPVPPAAEWLLDNFYLLEEQVKEIRQNLIREKCLRLNILDSGFLKGYPRVYAIALELVSHLDGRIDEKVTVDFIKAYQSNSILSMGELWALPMMLKMALMENLKNICAKVGRSQMEWCKAEKMPLNALPDLDGFMGAHHTLHKGAFSLVEHLLKRARREGGDTSRLYDFLEKKLQEFDLAVEQVVQEEHREQAARQVAMGNSITSMRLLTSINWNDVFENLSFVEGMLRQDPDGTYSRMDFPSRDYYRHQVEKIAKQLRTSETHVVRNALELARRGEGKNFKARHIGYFIFGEGKNLLLQTIGKRKGGAKSFSPLARYLIYVASLTGLLVVLFLFYAYQAAPEKKISVLVLVGLGVLIPVSDIAINLVQRVITRKTAPAFLPKLAFGEGIPEEAATLVVIPTLLPNALRAKELIDQLEVHYLSNKEKNLYFALLGDVKDAEEENLPGDEEIWESAEAGVKRLNEKYADQEPIFYFFLRKRRYLAREKRWMAWERKRGALMELNRLLANPRDTGSFRQGSDPAFLEKIRYVITVDADTRIPLHVAKKLIGTIAHPLNKAVYDPAKGIVMEGYGLIQPRIGVNVESANKTLFSRIFAGQGGIDPYTSAVSDIYQDYFGEGIFTGKGIYEVKAFQQALNGVIPENTVLSHDLLEGCYVRVGLATDLELVDAYPARYNSYIMRMHRWVRGDWQLIRWLVTKNSLSPLSKWKIFDNLRRSLISLSVLLLFTLGLTVFPGKASVWLGLGLLAVGLPLVLGFLDFLIFKHYKTEWKKCHSNMIFGLKAVLYQVLLTWIFLPYQAYMMTDAMIRTLYRVFFSRKKMLEWVTAADVEKTLKNNGTSFFYTMFPALGEAVIIFFLVLFWAPENLGYAFFSCLMWIGSPWVAYQISKDDGKKQPHLDREAKEALEALARKIWAFYEDFAGEKDHFLPPDNYQENPPNGIAHRTSPTNIGFLLLAILTARDFGFIHTGEMAQKIGRTLDTVERMKKWKGHLYNWYDTRTLEILRPAYISSVDSGNFVGFLITLKQGLAEYLERSLAEPDGIAPQLEHLMARIDALVSATYFAPLFDEQKQLFSIGYNVEEEKLTNSYYDLFASEARITSFLAVVRGEVPEEHWFRLGKSLTMVDGYKGLVSWAGTMFEYLMPLLIMKSYSNTLLDETYRFVVKAQQKYGLQRKVPWGTSESGFYAFDIQLNYQYKACGVPDLGLKRGLINDMVVSPYSTFLALPLDPVSAWENIKRLREDGVEGNYGLYEAVDYTPERLFMGRKKGIVQSYMAHHQGMSLIALNNFFHENVMQRRFHQDPLVKAGELLLQEKVPLRVILTKENKERVEPFAPEEKEQADAMGKYVAPNLSGVSCHLLSNGRYSVLVTKEGLGYSRQDGVQVTRWRDRGFAGRSGFFIFVREMQSNQAWSVTQEPFLKAPDQYQAIFSPHKAEFIRDDGLITTHTEITVSPEDQAEIREVSLANHGEEPAVLDITSYLEIVLTSHATDVAHPVFSNLFVRTEALPKYEGILAFRRPRENNRPVTWAIHTMVVDGEALGNYQYETDRGKFLGRNRTIAYPLALDAGHPLSNSIGPVLDPVLSLRRRIKINPGKTAKIAFVVAVADDRVQAMELAEKYHENASIKRAFELAWSRGRIEEGYLNLKPEETEVYQEMVAHLVFLSPLRRKYQDLFRKNRKGQPGLWAYGVSGDLPMVLVTIKNTDEIGLVKSALKAHEYWRFKGLNVDLVILNEDETGYLQPVQDQIMETVQSSLAREVFNCPGGVFVLNARLMPAEDRVLFFTVARIILKGEDGPLAVQLKTDREADHLPEEKIFPGPKRAYVSKDTPLNLTYFNGYGGFDLEGKEYVIRLKEEMHTPAPWTNVISNPGFGFLVTESGAGFTWAENSRENKLTPWSNDPVSDPPGEVYYMRDEDSGALWSLTPLPIREKESYTVRHGLGYSHFRHHSQGIGQELTLFVSPDDPVKIGLIRLTNQEPETRKLSLTYYLKPVLGVTDQITQQFISSEYQGDLHSIIVNNSYQHDFPGRLVFVSSSEPVHSFTGDEEEFIGREGSLVFPQALKREKLSDSLPTGSYSCVAVQVAFELPPGGEKEIVFLLGQEKNMEAVHALVPKYLSPVSAKEALARVKASWLERLGTIQVATPDLSMDIMINYWLLYQVLSCRVWSRSAFYQSGGAYGFRDQLQDVLSLIYAQPEVTRNQILLHCAHQYLEGDVQHWWHPGAGDKGVRTRFSDDLLWLPYVVAEYVDKTGDFDLLHVPVPYLEEEPLKEGEQERYGIPRVSHETSSVYEHCIRSIERAAQFGIHGLPLMGSGDWNDGMNAVGSSGQGESVWLGWFLVKVLQSFSPLCQAMKDPERAEKYLDTAVRIKQNIEENAWDGNWYRRAYFDDSRPLGSAENTECKIDSLAQSWAVISGAAREDRIREAMTAVENYLVKKEEGLILLLTPPFDAGDLNPGYIKGYVPGVRENGGQYTHAAVWVISAFARMSLGDKAWALYHMINPINHSRTSIESAVYKAEPYVMAADVYAVYPHVGRGGWTWYTGAASWMYRVGLEEILGLRKEGEKLFLDPCIPRDWPEYEIKYKYQQTLYQIHVRNPLGVNKGVKTMMLDGKEMKDLIIPLVNDQKDHQVQVVMG